MRFGQIKNYDGQLNFVELLHFCQFLASKIIPSDSNFLANFFALLTFPSDSNLKTFFAADSLSNSLYVPLAKIVFTIKIKACGNKKDNYFLGL